MDYRNADGSNAEMCGNGIRVMARFLLDNGLAELSSGSTLPIATRNGIMDLTATQTGFAVDLGLFKVGDDESLVKVRGLGVPRPALEVSLGNPHRVVALADVAELEELDLTRPPQLEPEPEDGANVEFVVLDEPLIRREWLVLPCGSMSAVWGDHELRHGYCCCCDRHPALCRR